MRKFIFALVMSVFLCGFALPVLGNSIAPPGSVAIETHKDLKIFDAKMTPSADRVSDQFPFGNREICPLCASLKYLPETSSGQTLDASGQLTSNEARNDVKGGVPTQRPKPMGTQRV